jgi:hypothetical protein
MAQAGPSSVKKATTQKQKQKQKVTKVKKSALARKTVEFLDKAALEYVRATPSGALLRGG